MLVGSRGCISALLALKHAPNDWTRAIEVKLVDSLAVVGQRKPTGSGELFDEAQVVKHD